MAGGSTVLGVRFQSRVTVAVRARQRPAAISGLGFRVSWSRAVALSLRIFLAPPGRAQVLFMKEHASSPSKTPVTRKIHSLIICSMVTA